MSEHSLCETITFNNQKDAELISNTWSKGLSFYAERKLHCGKEYNTTLKDVETKLWYITNYFDPRVRQWCKDNNIVPRHLQV